MTTNTKPKRGEVTRVSIEVIEKNIDKPFDEIATIVAEALGAEFARTAAKSHIRWLLRSGLINDKAGATKAWPKRNAVERAPVAKKAKAVKAPKHVVSKAAEKIANAVIVKAPKIVDGMKPATKMLHDMVKAKAAEKKAA